jgi:hypothetical protein
MRPRRYYLQLSFIDDAKRTSWESCNQSRRNKREIAIRIRAQGNHCRRKVTSRNKVIFIRQITQLEIRSWTSRFTDPLS